VANSADNIIYAIPSAGIRGSTAGTGIVINRMRRYRRDRLAVERAEVRFRTGLHAHGT
jgi:hypothetical protein